VTQSPAKHAARRETGPAGFAHAARVAANALGSPYAFAIAVITVLAWALTGPYFGYSEVWQLVINTGTTIVTFLMIFLVQNTQNRDARALHLKLDELIRSIHAARNKLIDLEDCTDEELDHIQREFERLRDRGRRGERRAR
jgi:low affinity Fe/Cu permease